MTYLSHIFPNNVEVFFVRNEILSFSLHFSCDAVSCFLDFALTVLGVFEAQYLFANSFIFSELFRSVSGFSSEVSFNDDVCDSHHFFLLVGMYAVFISFSSRVILNIS